MSDDQHRDDDEFQYDETSDGTDVGPDDGADVQDDATDVQDDAADVQDDAFGAASAGAAAATADPSDEDGEHHTKLCRYCISEIDALATRCCRCSGDLRFVEGTDIAQNWNMLFFCVAVFIACIWLPLDRQPHYLYPSQTFAGGLLAVFAGFGMLASYGNILQRKAIYWPVLFMAFDGLYVGIRGYVGEFGQLPDGAAARDYILMGGPALPIILVCSLLSLWTFMKGIASGRSKAKAAKEAARRR